MQTHCKDMLESFIELVLEDAASDEDRVVCILASLPTSYDMLLTALEANKEVPDVDNCHGKIDL